MCERRQFVAGDVASCRPIAERVRKAFAPLTIMLRGARGPFCSLSPPNAFPRAIPDRCFACKTKLKSLNSTPNRLQNCVLNAPLPATNAGSDFGDHFGGHFGGYSGGHS